MSSIWAGVNTSHPSRSFFRLNETAISFRCQKFNSLFKKSKNVTLSRRSCLTDFKICKKWWLINQHEPIVTVAFCAPANWASILLEKLTSKSVLRDKLRFVPLLLKDATKNWIKIRANGGVWYRMQIKTTKMGSRVFAIRHRQSWSELRLKAATGGML